ncbi:hypothetical protein F0562_025143 [Nyssa sinensis]|uniref:Uncharacterized protein n=1 Tax=Nyssa sinensis TaxID=561372 RepID=A0A5J5BG39_9ASTE|nr:hypothetical protein F0562_025143 [Nyssa sinensis]
MTKNRWREPFKSFASHITPEKDQVLQGTKIGKTMACCRVEVLYCIAVEPDDSPLIRKEDALVRKLAGSRGVSQGRNNDDMMDDLDEMIFGKKAGGTSEGGHDTKKPQSPKDDLITF